MEQYTCEQTPKQRAYLECQGYCTTLLFHSLSRFDKPTGKNLQLDHPLRYRPADFQPIAAKNRFPPWADTLSRRIDVLKIFNQSSFITASIASQKVIKLPQVGWRCKISGILYHAWALARLECFGLPHSQTKPNGDKKEKIFKTVLPTLFLL